MSTKQPIKCPHCEQDITGNAVVVGARRYCWTMAWFLLGLRSEPCK